MDTIGDAISRIRNTTKTVKEDAFLTDRFLFSIIIKHARLFIRKQDSLNDLIKFASLFRAIPCMELEPTDKVEACCGGITSDCIIMRTVKEIPGVMEASFGPLLRTISSIDGSIRVDPTTPETYTSMTKTTTFKYNKQKYYWIMNNRLYFPNIEWEAVRVEGIFEGDLSTVACDADPCVCRYDQPLLIPGYLFSQIEQQVLVDLGLTVKLPEDGPNDKTSNFR